MSSFSWATRYLRELGPHVIMESPLLISSHLGSTRLRNSLASHPRARRLPPPPVVPTVTINNMSVFDRLMKRRRKNFISFNNWLFFQVNSNLAPIPLRAWCPSSDPRSVMSRTAAGPSRTTRTSPHTTDPCTGSACVLSRSIEEQKY